MDPKTLEELSRRIDEALPAGLDRIRDDLRKNVRAALGGALERMDLVSREEFDVQAAVLARTRSKLAELEAEVARLEDELRRRDESGQARGRLRPRPRPAEVGPDRSGAGAGTHRHGRDAMALAVAYCRAAHGIDAPLVSVETHLSGGLPRFSMAGLPASAVRESKDRVRGALMTCGYSFPQEHITVNLAPADLPKDGGRFDLAIAVTILAASRQIDDRSLLDHELVGELSMTGDVRPVKGTLPAAFRAREAARPLVVPQANAEEAALVAGAKVLPVATLYELSAHLNGERTIAAHRPGDTAREPPAVEDLAEVSGQFHAKRALEIAAAGGHNLLMIGSPGIGKTMLATRLPGILPRMSEPEALESAAIRSVSRLPFDPFLWRRRPFRAPHHTASSIALVGGGSPPHPGEISLAHNGVLFLDELPEFDRKVLEALREPLESARIVVSRAARQAEYPARFQLVAAMNPCPCGRLGDGSERCRCTHDQVDRYRSRISGPLLDRIDLQIAVSPSDAEPAAQGAAGGEPSEVVRARVDEARRRQLARNGYPNQQLRPRELAEACRPDPAAAALLDTAAAKLRLSIRGRHRVLRVARTIADLVADPRVTDGHLREALAYRGLDRP